MLSIELHEARSRLRALIDAARSGEEVYISAGASGLSGLLRAMCPKIVRLGQPAVRVACVDKFGSPRISTL